MDTRSNSLRPELLRPRRGARTSDKFNMATRSLLVLLAGSLGTVGACSQSKGRYFPVGSLWPDTPKNDTRVRQMLSRDLEGMHEPVLWSRKSGESIRLVQTFTDGKVRLVRLEGPPAQLTIRALEYLSGNPGRVRNQRESNISPDEWREAIAWLDQISFWSLPANVRDVDLDSSPDILERSSGGRYHVIIRYRRLDGFRDVENRLLSLARLWWLPPVRQ